MTQVVFAQVKEIKVRDLFLGLIPHNRDKVAVLSTNHEFNVRSTDLTGSNPVEVDGWYFFEVTEGSLYWRSHTRVSKSDATKINYAFENLKNSTHRVCNSLKGLTNHDRNIVLRSAGLAVTAWGTVAATVGTVTAVMAWEPITATTCGVTALGLGAFSWFQYESLSDAVKQRVEIVKEADQAMRNYARFINKYMPNYMAGCKPLNPEVRSAATDIVQYVVDFNIRKLWAGTWEYVTV